MNSSAPATEAENVTPSDTTEVGYRGVFVGTGGNVAIQALSSNSSVIFKNVPDGWTLPVQARKILATGTTATDIIGLR